MICSKIEGNCIYVTGPIAAGKTTLARLISERGISECECEEYQGNPFLNRFLTDPMKFALETEITFILMHYRQLLDTLSGNKSLLVFDWAPIHDAWYARTILNDKDYEVFEVVHNHLLEQQPEPVVTICLHAGVEDIKKRMMLRDREIEREVPEEYLAKLVEEFEKGMASLPEDKVINVDISKEDILNDGVTFNRILKELRSFL